MAHPCSCGEHYASSVALYDHLCRYHRFEATVAFIVAQLSALGVRLHWLRDGEDDVIILGVELPMPE